MVLLWEYSPKTIHKKENIVTDQIDVDITSEKMPKELKIKLEKLPPFARRYAEYRAKGLKQADASEKAGSNASTRASLSRVGWNTEQLDGVKEYILWLEHKRAKASVIDDLELIDMFRDVYKEAMENGKYADANKAAEHLGNMVNAFGKIKTKEEETSKGEAKKTKNNTKAFTEDREEETIEEKVARLQRLIQQDKKIVSD